MYEPNDLPWWAEQRRPLSVRKKFIRKSKSKMNEAPPYRVCVLDRVQTDETDVVVGVFQSGDALARSLQGRVLLLLHVPCWQKRLINRCLYYWMQRRGSYFSTHSRELCLASAKGYYCILTFASFIFLWLKYVVNRNRNWNTWNISFGLESEKGN